ncbi:MAG: hypothetical protein GYB31_00405 [Bacteroidetes bacterium]|nr:hypothetical protein [Bacteroidota bacterium]
MKYYILILAAGLFFSACQGTQENEKKQEETQKESPTKVLQPIKAPPAFVAYRNEGHGFGMAYPANWEVEEGTAGTVILVKSPLSGTDDPFQESVNVVVNDVAERGISNLDQFVMRSEKDLAESIESFMMVKSERIIWAGQETHEFIFNGHLNGFHLRWQQRLVYIDGKGYVISYTALQDTFNKYASILNMIFDSFAFAQE